MVTETILSSVKETNVRCDPFFCSFSEAGSPAENGIPSDLSKTAKWTKSTVSISSLLTFKSSDENRKRKQRCVHRSLAFAEDACSAHEGIYLKGLKTVLILRQL